MVLPTTLNQLTGYLTPTHTLPTANQLASTPIYRYDDRFANQLDTRPYTRCNTPETGLLVTTLDTRPEPVTTKTCPPPRLPLPLNQQVH